ncbi:MAG TPA: PfkB family carbohydrate kinase [Bacteroidales bacterium]|nr:PfkB family carbohydrate kinase [Bacteroidales bacterium]
MSEKYRAARSFPVIIVHFVMIWTTGEALLDIIHAPDGFTTLSPGGAMLNTAVDLGRCHLPVGFIGGLGDDAPGRMVRDFLNKSRVGSQHLRALPAWRTPVALALLDSGGNASYTFYRDPAGEYAPEYPVPGPGDLLLYGSYHALHDQVHHTLLSWLHSCRERGVMLIYDPNFRRPHLHELPRLKPRILDLIRCAHLLKASDEDLQLVFRFSSGGEAWDNLCNIGPRALAYTRGARGASWYASDWELRFPAPEVDVLSTIGAGDAFNAGLLAALAQVSNPTGVLLLEDFAKQALHQAQSLASMVCQRWENHVPQLSLR